MEFEISTPALLFPAVSLLFLSYTNRFLHLAALVRKLHADWEQMHDETLLIQIENLRIRLRLIRWMQLLGALSLLLCTLAMAFVLVGFVACGKFFFGGAVILMTFSLCSLVREVIISGGALNILLDCVEEGKRS